MLSLSRLCPAGAGPGRACIGEDQNLTRTPTKNCRPDLL